VLERRRDGGRHDDKELLSLFGGVAVCVGEKERRRGGEEERRRGEMVGHTVTMIRSCSASSRRNRSLSPLSHSLSALFHSLSALSVSRSLLLHYQSPETVGGCACVGQLYSLLLQLLKYCC
jgi:hypothetical protein